MKRLQQTRREFAAAAALPLLPAVLTAQKNNGGHSLYVGTYTTKNGSSKGIYHYRFDSRAGVLEEVGLAAAITNPSFLAWSPDGAHLYAVSELGATGPQRGSVSSFACSGKDGALQHLNTVVTGGGGACHLVVDKTRKMLVAANYTTGSVASFAVKADGSLSELVSLVQHSGSSVDVKRQKGPHAHAVVLSADNRFVFVPDLGTDEIKAYRMEPAAAKLQEPAASTAHVKPGSGPRHFAFHPGNRFAYSVNEMASSVTAFSYEAKSGTLTALETVSNLPEDFHGEDNSAEISLDRAGRFLYASNRGHDSITVYAVDSGKGTLTKVQVVATGGKTPRSFALDPTGRFLLAANQDTNNIQVFSVDTKTGKLTAQGTPVAASSPVCLLFALRS